MSECQTKAGNHECMNVWMFWTTFVFMSMLKTYSHTFSLSLTLTLSHSHTLSISHSITLDMLNNFCFDLYAQKWLFIAENCNAFFLTSSSSSREFRVSRAGSQLKMSESQTKAGNQKKFENLKIWKFKNFKNLNSKFKMA